MKKIIYILLLLSLSIFIPLVVNASEINISSDILLKAYLSTGGELKLTDDITLTDNTAINEDVVLDLNGHTLDMSDKTLIPYAKLTIKDTSSDKTGKITSTASFTIQIGSTNNPGSVVLDGGTIDCRGSYCVRVIAQSTLTVNDGTILGTAYPVYNQSNFVMNGGLVHSTTGYAVLNHTNSTFEMNGGTIKTDANYPAMNLYGNCKATINDGQIIALKEEEGGYSGNGISLYKNTELIINGGSITSYGSAIIGNGSGPEGGKSEGTNAKITINGGTITATNVGCAIYAPQQQGVTTINGGTLTGKTGIEIRAGKLIITGGTINGDANEYSVTANTNGMTTKGAAVAVAQHTTKQPIYVHISGGEFNANVAVSEANPMDNAAEYIDLIEIIIEKGMFNSESDKTVKIEDDFTQIISGGSFTNTVESLVKDGYAEVDENNRKVVYKINPINITNSSNGSVISSLTEAPKTKEVKLTLTPNEGYKLLLLEVTDSHGNKINVSNNKFVMPDDEVNVTGKFVKIITNEVNTNNNTQEQDNANGVLDKEKTDEVILDTISESTNNYNDANLVELVISSKDKDKEEINNIKKAISIEGVEVGHLYDISIVVKDSSGNVLGNISELKEEIEIVVQIPKELQNTNKDVKREYYIIRNHDGYEVLDTVYSNDNKTLKFKSKLFSDYIIAYQDVIDNPKTIDNINDYVLLFVESISLLGMIVLIKKKVLSI